MSDIWGRSIEPQILERRVVRNQKILGSPRHENGYRVYLECAYGSPLMPSAERRPAHKRLSKAILMSELLNTRKEAENWVPSFAQVVQVWGFCDYSDMGHLYAS